MWQTSGKGRENYAEGDEIVLSSEAGTEGDPPSGATVRRCTSLCSVSLRRKTRGEIEDMIVIFGTSRTVELGSEGYWSPGVSKYIREASRALIAFDMGGKTPGQLRVIGEWTLKHKQSNAIRRHLAGKRALDRNTVAKLQAFIQRDTPLEESDGKKRKFRRSSSEVARSESHHRS